MENRLLILLDKAINDKMIASAIIDSFTEKIIRMLRMQVLKDFKTYYSDLEKYEAVGSRIIASFDCNKFEVEILYLRSLEDSVLTARQRRMIREATKRIKEIDRVNISDFNLTPSQKKEISKTRYFSFMLEEVDEMLSDY